MTTINGKFYQLLPCPFCGRDDYLSVLKSGPKNPHNSPHAHFVYCGVCHSQGRCTYPIGWVESEKAAEEAWNDRKLHSSVSLKRRLDIAVKALEKLADPRKREHVHSCKYTEVGCLMSIAEEALNEIGEKCEDAHQMGKS